MPATSSQTIYTEATCYSCLGLVTPFETMVIGALIQANTALGVTMTPQEWLDEATCYVCLPGVSQAKAVIIAMLDSISQNAGSGSAQMLVYTGADPTADGLIPTNINSPAIAYKLDGSSGTYVWNTNTHVWN